MVRINLDKEKARFGLQNPGSVLIHVKDFDYFRHAESATCSMIVFALIVRTSLSESGQFKGF